jgi:nucleoside phosphorylase
MIGLSLKRLVDWARQPLTQPHEVDAHACRFARRPDCGELFEVARAAGLDALDTTPPAAYQKWLELDSYSIRVFEDFSRNSPDRKTIQGYYTLFIFRSEFFEQFAKGRASYDELNNQCVVRLTTYAIDPDPSPKIIPNRKGLAALVFDMGARNISLAPAYSRWIVADLLWRIDHLLTQNDDIEQVGIFATNGSSANLAEYFEMKPVPGFLNERYPDWRIFVTNRATYFEEVRGRRELSALYNSNIWTRAYELSPTDRKLIGEMMDPIYAARVRRRRLNTPGRALLVSDEYSCDVLIMVATDVERDTVLDLAKIQTGRGYRQLFGKRRTYYELGELGGAHLAVVQCEMGSGSPGASQATASDAVDDLKPETVILAGIAFGVDPEKQKIGDILVSKQLKPYELQRIGTDEHGGLKILSRGDRVTASTRVIGRLRAARPAWEGADVRFELILTGEKLVDQIDFRQQLEAFEPEADGGEMEGAGLYAACADRGTDWIIVKAICDWADGKKREQKEERQKLAAKEAFGFVLHAIAQGGFTRGSNDVRRL